MNPDKSPSPSTQSASATPPARASNLKSRWKRQPSRNVPPHPGVSSSDPAVKPSFGEITDIASARESLSGEHIRGYEGSDVPPPEAKSHKPVSKSNDQPPRPSLDNVPAFKPEGHTGIESHHRRESRPAPVSIPPSMPPVDASGEKAANYISLKPDPANDLAPRRIRTEIGVSPIPSKTAKPTLKERMLHRPAPVIIRTPHKIIKREKTEDPTETRRSHASVPAKVESSRKPKPKTGLLYLIKRVLGVIPDAPEEKVVLETKPSSSSSSHGSHSRHSSHSSHKRRRRHSHHSHSHSHDSD